ncbi:MAG: hypothetical protein NTW68_03010 [candidate division NC10 bacterium]|nr:hypothetical protein [candidate division NC10 bacterium]
MADVIRFLLQNFTVTLLVLGLVASTASLLRMPRPLTSRMIVSESIRQQLAPIR